MLRIKLNGICPGTHLEASSQICVNERLFSVVQKGKCFICSIKCILKKKKKINRARHKYFGNSPLVRSREVCVAFHQADLDVALEER